MRLPFPLCAVAVGTFEGEPDLGSALFLGPSTLMFTRAVGARMLRSASPVGVAVGVAVGAGARMSEEGTGVDRIVFGNGPDMHHGARIEQRRDTSIRRADGAGFDSLLLRRLGAAGHGYYTYTSLHTRFIHIHVHAPYMYSAPETG